MGAQARLFGQRGQHDERQCGGSGRPSGWARPGYLAFGGAGRPPAGRGYPGAQEERGGGGGGDGGAGGGEGGGRRSGGEAGGGGGTRGAGEGGGGGRAAG